MYGALKGIVVRSNHRDFKGIGQVSQITTNAKEQYDSDKQNGTKRESYN